MKAQSKTDRIAAYPILIVCICKGKPSEHKKVKVCVLLVDHGRNGNILHNNPFGLCRLMRGIGECNFLRAL